MDNKLKGKDLITIGIYTAIYFAINFAFMVAGIIPVMWILMSALIALFTGIPYMMICNKVKKPGAILIMGTITVLIYYATGQFTTVILTTFVIGCILAEIIRKVTNYNSFLGNTLSFAFFSIGMIGSPLPIWLFKESFFAHIAGWNVPGLYKYLRKIYFTCGTDRSLCFDSNMCSTRFFVCKDDNEKTF